jgi:cyclic pyranopterin phosphate synthase
MTTNGILLSQFAKELRVAGLKRVNISLDTMDAEKYRFITRGGDIESVFHGIEAAWDAGLTPIKLNCVIFGSSDEPDAKAVAEFAKANGFKVQFIHQMDLETGHFSRVEGGEGGNCKSCNRLRLTANGCVKPCLFNEKGYNVREFGSDKAFHLAIDNKPLCGSKNRSGKFYNIGG